MTRQTGILAFKSLAFLVFLYAVIYALAGHGGVSVHVSETLPKTLKNENIIIQLDKSSYAYDYILDVTFNGALYVKEGTEKPIALIGSSSKKASRPICELTEDNLTHCRLMLSSDGSPETLKLIGRSLVSVHSAEIQIIRQNHITSFNSEYAVYFIAWLFILMVIVRIWYKKIALCQWLLIGSSIIFLSLNHIFFTCCLVSLLVVSYLARKKLRSNTGNSAKHLSIAITIAVLFLAIFKYFQEAAVSVFANPGGLNLILPLGISYFIIRLIDTLMRWYRREQLDISLREFLCFILFPGTLVAGPIETIDQFYKQRLKYITRDDVTFMLYRICIGLFKKIVIADYLLMKIIESSNFEQMAVTPNSVSGSTVIFNMFCVMAYAYFDFSSYSDMAIGLSRGLGYRIRENFNFPMLACNLRDYWKRWHISLSDWCMRNVYFTLMIKTRNSYIPLYATMLMVGLWHALTFSWFFWAIHHATGLCVVTYIQSKVKLEKYWLMILIPYRIIFTMLYVMAGFCFVWFSSFDVAFGVYRRFISALIPF